MYGFNGQSEYYTPKNQTLIKHMLQNSNIESKFDDIRGALFNNLIIIKFKDDTEIEMEEQEDLFYSALGIGLLKQIAMWNMILFRFQKKKNENGDIITIPELPHNGIIKYKFTNNKTNNQGGNKYIINWFFYNQNRVVHTKPDPFTIIKEFGHIDTVHNTFYSKFQSLIKPLHDLNIQKREQRYLQNLQKQPRYYYQRTHIPFRGEYMKQNIDQEIEQLQTKQHGQDNKNSETGFKESHYIDEGVRNRDVRDFLQRNISGLTTLNQGTGEFELEYINEGLATDEYFAEHGHPYYDAKERIAPHIVSGKLSRIPEIGESMEIKLIPPPPDNQATLEFYDKKFTKSVNELFGISSYRNLDQTRLGSSVYVKNLNNFTKAWAEKASQALSIVYREHLIRDHPEKVDNFKSLSITPSLILSENVSMSLLKFAQEIGNMRLLSELLKNTEGFVLTTLEEKNYTPIKKDNKKEEQEEQEEQKEDIEQPEKDIEDKNKKTGKKRKREELNSIPINNNNTTAPKKRKLN